MSTPAGRLLTIAIAMATLAGSAGAGQVFVAVGSPGNRFTPARAGTATQGDFVIWTWATSGHTVTSGTSGTPNGIFNTDPSGTTTQSAGSVFAWKTDRTGNIQYYSRPDVAFGMTGQIVVPDALPSLADFRITEVRFDNAGSDFIEIANLGTGDGNLRGFRLSINGADPPTTPALWSGSRFLGAGLRDSVPNPPGLTDVGSVALYAPFLLGSIPGTAAATDTTMIVDYVEWGPTGGQPLEDIAIRVISPAEIWFAGQFAPQAKPGHSIVFCGTADDHGSAMWNESTVPTPGSGNNCSDAVHKTTWGRLKALYR